MREKTSGHRELDPFESASTVGHSRPLHDVVNAVCECESYKESR